VKPFGLAATLHDAVALAHGFGPRARISFGPPDGETDILAPAGRVLGPAAVAGIPAGRSQYFFAFGDAAAAPVIDALTNATGTGFMVACLAAPWRKRTVYQGHLFENGVLIGNLLRDFAMELQGGAGLVPHETVAAGAAAIRRRCAALKEQGKALALVDAIDEDDCAAVADSFAGFPLAGGGAWLAEKNPAVAAQPAGPVAILSGALDRQTVFQLGAARLVMPVYDLDFLRSNPAAAALAWAAEQKIGEVFVLASTASPDRVTAGADAAGALGEVAKGLVAAGIRRLVITGEDTARAVLAALGITAVTVGAGLGPLRWLHAGELALCLKPPGAGTKSLFLYDFEPQIRLNATAE
jgi:uncharacterized protein YgbK (DUF1537 family)